MHTEQLDGEFNMHKVNIARTDYIVVRENPALMPTAEITAEEARFNAWVADQLTNLRKTWMHANGIASKAEFAKRVGVDWKTIWNLEKGRNVPGVDMLNKIVTACDSNLGEFFSKLINRMELAAIELSNKEETEWIDDLVKGLSYPETRVIVQHYARAIRGYLAAK